MKENPNINIDGFLRKLLNKFPGYKVNEITLDIKRKGLMSDAVFNASQAIEDY